MFGLSGILGIGITGILAMALKDVPAKIWSIFKTRFVSSISVTSSNNKVYRRISEYILSLNKSPISNNVETSELGESSVSSINYGFYIVKMDKLTYMIINKKMKDTTWNISSIIDISIFGIKRKEIFNHIHGIVQSLNDENYLNVFASPNRYERPTQVIKKSFDSVFCEDRVKTRIINSLDNWLDNKELYRKNGIVHKLGILLYGLHGTGKSSLSRCIASYLNYNVYCINLKSYENSTQLMERLLGISPKSVVLFEDIDCIIGDREVKDGKEDKSGELLNIALNFIDGVISPEDCIIVATTNYIDRLDQALIRDGRFDIKEEVGNISVNKANEMCKSYNISDIGVLGYSGVDNINPSELQNKIISYISKVK